MRRRLFKVATALSLVLCVAGTFFALRGIWREDVADVHSSSRRIAIASAWGKVAIGATDGPCPMETQGWHGFTSTAWDEPRNLCRPLSNEAILSYEFGHAGIAYDAGWFRDPRATVAIKRSHWWTFQFPLWILAWLAALLPAWRFQKEWRRWRSVRLAARSPCTTCGYSLIGNTSGICPECGTPVADEAGAKA